MSLEGISQHVKPGVRCGFAAVAAPTLVLVAVLSYVFWWRSWGSARASKFSRIAAATAGGSSSLPSPVALLPRWLGPVGGHTLQITSEQMVQQLETWADELGGNYELAVFGQRTVVAASVSDVRRVLHQRPHIFRRGLNPSHFHRPAKKIGLLPSLFFDEGKEWGRSRRLICPWLVGNNVADMAPSIAKIAERFCAQAGEKADAGEVLDAIFAFERFAHDAVALAAFGLETNSMGTPKDQPCPSFDGVRTVMRSFVKLMLQPLAMLGWIAIPWLLPWVRDTHDKTKQLQDAVQGAIDKARLANAKSAQTASGTDAVKNTSGGALLRNMVATADGKRDAKHLPDRMGFTDVEIVRQVMSLFIGGTGTTAFILSWAMYYLTKNPKMFARCREEALQAAPESNNGLVTTREQHSKLVFCSAVFKEAIRLNSSSTVLFFHNKEATTMGNGTVLKKNTGVIALTRYVGLSEDCFTRAKEFVPERWIKEEREEALLGKGQKDAGNRTVNHDEDAFLSLGAGPRVCPGQNFAKTVGSTIIGALCARFDVALAPGQADPPDEILTYASGPRTARFILTKRVTS